MRTLRHALAGPAALALVLSAGLAAPVVLAPTAAVAQSAAPRSVVEMKLIGRYRNGPYFFRIDRDNQGVLRLWVTKENVGDVFQGRLEPTRDGTALEGDYTAAGKPDQVVGRVRFTPAGADGSINMREIGAGGKSLVLTGTDWFAYRNPKPDTEPLVPWIGQWSTSEGTLTFSAARDSAFVEGVVEVKDRQGVPQARRRFVFQPAGPGKLVGAWSSPDSPAYGGDAQLTLSADGKSFTGGLGQTNTSNPTISGKKIADADITNEWRLKPAAGDWHPKPGYLTCGGWCEAKIVGTEIKTIRYDGDGSYMPMLMVRVALHNVSEYEHTFQPDRGSTPQAADTVRVYAVQGTRRLAQYNSTGPVQPGDGMLTLRSVNTSKPVTMPSGSEVTGEFWILAVPEDADGLEIVFAGKSLGTVDAKAAWCAVFKKVTDLKAAGQLMSGTPLPKSPEKCGAGGGTAGSGSGETGTPPAGSTGSGPAPTPAPAPAPAPAPGGSSAGGASAPAADEFKPLWKYAVKVESVDVRDDQRIQVVAVLKNRTQSPLYLTSGALMVSVVDPDGVAQQTGQFVRATGEPPQLFNATPVIQPGATIRVRYLFKPDGEDRPSKVTFTEGSRTAEFAGQ
jgi:hypothetical protein